MKSGRNDVTRKCKQSAASYAASIRLRGTLPRAELNAVGEPGESKGIAP